MGQKKKLRKEHKKARRVQLNNAILKALQDHRDVVRRVQKRTTVWVTIRFICAVVLFAMAISGYLDLDAAAAGDLIFSVAGAFLLSSLLCQGMRIFAWLILAGTAYSIANFLLSLGRIGPYLVHSPVLILSMGVMILDIVTSLVVMIPLVRDPGYKALAAERKQIHNTIR